MKASKADRQHLISHYGFKCECDQCSLNETQSIESDLRIERIKFVFQQLTDFGTWSKANLDLADELIQLYQLVRSFHLSSTTGFFAPPISFSNEQKQAFFLF